MSVGTSRRNRITVHYHFFYVIKRQIGPQRCFLSLMLLQPLEHCTQHPLKICQVGFNTPECCASVVTSIILSLFCHFLSMQYISLPLLDIETLLSCLAPLTSPILITKDLSSELKCRHVISSSMYQLFYFITDHAVNVCSLAVLMMKEAVFVLAFGFTLNISSMNTELTTLTEKFFRLSPLPLFYSCASVNLFEASLYVSRLWREDKCLHQC